MQTAEAINEASPVNASPVALTAERTRSIRIWSQRLRLHDVLKQTVNNYTGDKVNGTSCEAVHSCT